MSLTSKGYAGAIYPADWAVLAPALGHRYGVLTSGAWRVTAMTNGLLQSKVAAGSGFGRGIVDTETADTVLNHAPNTVAGTTRWDPVFAHRDFTAKLTTFTTETGSTSQTAAIALRVSILGLLDDQPIGLVPIVAGSSNPGAPISLRCYQGEGGTVADDVLALQYLTDPGTTVLIGTDLWFRTPAGATLMVPLGDITARQPCIYRRRTGAAFGILANTWSPVQLNDSTGMTPIGSWAQTAGTVVIPETGWYVLSGACAVTAASDHLVRFVAGSEVLGPTASAGVNLHSETLTVLSRLDEGTVVNFQVFSPVAASGAPDSMAARTYMRVVKVAV